MAAPTLFRRLVLVQIIGAFALLLVFAAAFYVERNRTVARLTAQRWAPALRAAGGLEAVAAASTSQPDARAVRVSRERPRGTVQSNAWAPRIAMLADTLRDDGVPVREIVFAPGAGRPVTWLAVPAPDGGEQWLGFDDEVIESHVVQRAAVALLLGFLAVAAASGFAARRIARPLERLRRRIEDHDGCTTTDDARGKPPPAAGATLEIDAIEAAWGALRARLQHQESERALLLAGVSHDLRSPLARIRMAAELLPDATGIAARRASIVRNVEVADRLIDSFLDYVRAAELPLAETVDIAALARRAIELRDEASGALTLAAPARLDVPRANAQLLERLLGNLVDNASRHGRPPVRLHVHADGDDVIIDVDDHGPGIPAEAQAQLTQAFARGDASRGTPGTGLGLAIVQQIVRRMGGSLSFERAGDVQRARVRLPAR